MSKPRRGRRCHVGRRRDRQRVARGLGHAEAPGAVEPAQSAEHDGRAADGERCEQEPPSVDARPASRADHLASLGRADGCAALQQPASTRTTRRTRRRSRGSTESTLPVGRLNAATAPTAARTISPVSPIHGRRIDTMPRTAARMGITDDHPHHQGALVVRAERADRERLQPFGRRVDHGAADGDERRGLVVDERGDDLGDPQGEERGQHADRRPPDGGVASASAVEAAPWTHSLR